MLLYLSHLLHEAAVVQQKTQGMRQAGGPSSGGLRKANSRVILNIPESSPAVDAGNRRRATQQPSAKTFVQKYDTLLVFLGLVILLSVVGLLFVQSFYFNSVRVEDAVLLPPHRRERLEGIYFNQVGAAAD